MTEFDIELESCVRDPATIDWSKHSDGSVIFSAQAGTAEAIAEAEARGLTF